MWWGWEPGVGGSLPLPPRKATQFAQLQAAETFCLGKSQECGEAGIEQGLECMRAFMQSLTHQLCIEYVLWANIMGITLPCMPLPGTSEEPARQSG